MIPFFLRILSSRLFWLFIETFIKLNGLKIATKTAKINEISTHFTSAFMIKIMLKSSQSIKITTK